MDIYCRSMKTLNPDNKTIGKRQYPKILTALYSSKYFCWFKFFYLYFSNVYLTYKIHYKVNNNTSKNSKSINISKMNFSILLNIIMNKKRSK